jgi:hypothetical protein
MAWMVAVRLLRGEAGNHPDPQASAVRAVGRRGGHGRSAVTVEEQVEAGVIGSGALLRPRDQPGQSATAEPQRSSMRRVFHQITEPAQVSTNIPTMM